MSETAKWRTLIQELLASQRVDRDDERLLALRAEVERVEAELTRWRAMPLSKRLAVEMERADDCEKRAEAAEAALATAHRRRCLCCDHEADGCGPSDHLHPHTDPYCTALRALVRR